jgi:sortase A
MRAALQRATRRPRLTAAALLGAAGVILLGQGAWIQAKAVLAQILLERAFAETLATGRDAKPWSWADTWPVARVEAPRLGRSAIVLHGSSGQALAFGPGHVEGTPQPGKPGAAVFSAHRDTHFSFLRELRAGDELRVTRRDGVTLRFRVTDGSVVRFDASGLDPLAGLPRLVLSTCWPFDAKVPGPLRYLLEADLIVDSVGTRAGLLIHEDGNGPEPALKT